jgi:hypothetical protein
MEWRERPGDGEILREEDGLRGVVVGEVANGMDREHDDHSVVGHECRRGRWSRPKVFGGSVSFDESSQERDEEGVVANFIRCSETNEELELPRSQVRTGREERESDSLDSRYISNDSTLRWL